MRSYESWLGEGPERRLPELRLLSLLGLFDRPAEAAAVAGLRAGGHIRDAREGPQSLTDILGGGVLQAQVDLARVEEPVRVHVVVLHRQIGGAVEVPIPESDAMR